ncbi:MAG: hypothetical protein WCB64_07005 [Desulfobaccales bacterium]
MNAKEGLEKKIRHEMKQFVMVFLYLAILIGSFNTYKWLLMAEYHVGYFVYGYTLIEALVLAKVIIIGESLGIGQRFSNRPLIVPTLYKTLLFALFMLAFAILEHLIKGFLHGNDLAEVFQEVIRGRYEILSRILIMFVALIPFFAFGEAERALKEVNLFELFFRRREAVASDPSRGSTPPASG